MKSALQSLLTLLVLTIISGGIYPLVVTGIGQMFWPEKAQGSLVTHKGQIIGSSLIAQGFQKPEYFWPRPSASNYSTLPSQASNLGPTSKDLKKNLQTKAHALVQANPGQKAVPMDLITMSASGLDPHISLASARLQVARIAYARDMGEKGEEKIRKIIEAELKDPKLFETPEHPVNVLLLNLALDSQKTPYLIITSVEFGPLPLKNPKISSPCVAHFLTPR